MQKPIFFLVLLIHSLYSCQSSNTTTAHCETFDNMLAELQEFQTNPELYSIVKEMNEIDSFYAKTPIARDSFQSTFDRHNAILDKYPIEQVYRLIARQKRLMSSFYYSHALYQSYENILKEATAILEKYQVADQATDQCELANLYNYIGIYYLEQLNRELAITYLRKSLAINEKYCRPIEMAKDLGNIALAKIQAFETDAAKVDIEASLKLFEENIFVDSLTKMLYLREYNSILNIQNIIRINAIQESLIEHKFEFADSIRQRIKESFQSIIKNLDSFPAEKVEQEMTYSYISLISTFIQLTQSKPEIDSAAFYLQEFKQRYNGQFPTNFCTACPVLEALILAMQGKVADASTRVEKVQEQLQPQVSKEYFQTLTLISRVYYVLSQQTRDPLQKQQLLQKTVEAQESYLKTIQNIRKRIGNERGMDVLASDYNGINTYALYALNELWQTNPEQAYIEKALEISDLSKNDYTRLRINSRINQIEWKGVKKELALQEEKMRKKYVEILASFITAEDKTPYLKQYQDLSIQYAQFLDTISQSQSPEVLAYYNQRFNYEVPTIKNIRMELLGAESALVEYHIGSLGLHIIVITPSESTTFFIPSNDAFFDRIQKYFAAAKSRAGNGLQEPAYLLYETLFRPIDNWLSNRKYPISHLIIIPDKKLNPIPFGSLLTTVKESTDWGDQAYLHDKYAINYHFSTIDLLSSKKLSRLAGIPANDFGNFVALPNSNNAFEIGCNQDQAPNLSSFGEVISQRYNFTESFFETSESTLEQNIDDFRIVQLNMHGCYKDLEEPYLVTFPGKKEEDLLYLSEVYTLSLRTDLLTLASCNSAISANVSTNRGSQSLSRGFIYAGAKSILTSPNALPDESLSDLLLLFYDNLLNKGMSKSAALRAAKQQYLSKSDITNEVKHPFFWGGLMVYGLDDSIRLELEQ